MAGESVRIENLNAVLRTLSRMPKEASDGLRDEAQAIAQDIVGRAQGAATTPQARLAARSLKARRDRVPVIVAGGSKRLPVGGRKRRGPDLARQTFGDVFFGAEFGGSRGSIAALAGAGVGESTAYRSGGRTRYSVNRGSTRQFPPHRGRQGYWLYPTIRDMNAEITTRYFDALDRALVTAGAR